MVLYVQNGFICSEWFYMFRMVLYVQNGFIVLYFYASCESEHVKYSKAFFSLKSEHHKK